MGLEKGPRLESQDIFVDYEFEDVMFWWDHKAKIIYRKFYGEMFGVPVEHSNKLFNEALLHGAEITEEQYRRGKPKTGF